MQPVGPDPGAGQTVEDPAAVDERYGFSVEMDDPVSLLINAGFARDDDK